MKRLLLMAFLVLMANMQALAASNYVIKIDGMTCQYCAYNVKKRLKKLDGVEQVDVDQDQGLATLQVKAGIVLTDDRLKDLIAEAGYNYRGIQSKPE